MNYTESVYCVSARSQSPSEGSDGTGDETPGHKKQTQHHTKKRRSFRSKKKQTTESDSALIISPPWSDCDLSHSSTSKFKSLLSQFYTHNCHFTTICTDIKLKHVRPRHHVNMMICHYGVRMFIVAGKAGDDEGYDPRDGATKVRVHTCTFIKCSALRILSLVYFRHFKRSFSTNFYYLVRHIFSGVTRKKVLV